MKRILMIPWLLALLLLSACQLQDSYGGKVVLDGEQELSPGRTLDGDLVVLGGVFRQHPGAAISGAVHVFGGQVELAGTVGGSVTLLEGRLALAPGSDIRGDLNVLGGTLDRSPQARIAGTETVAPEAGQESPPETLPPTAGTAVRLLLEVPLLVLLAYLTARFTPARISTVRGALLGYPLICAATGLLAGVAGLSLAVLMAYTLLLIPASAGLLGLMLFAATFGAVPVAVLLGKAAYRRLRPHEPPVTQAAALGMLLLAALAEVLRLLPWVGGLAVILLLLTAFGATLLTRFGWQPFTPDSAS